MLRDELIKTATEANIKKLKHDKDRLELNMWDECNRKQILGYYHLSWKI